MRSHDRSTTILPNATYRLYPAEAFPFGLCRPSCLLCSSCTIALADRVASKRLASIINSSAVFDREYVRGSNTTKGPRIQLGPGWSRGAETAVEEVSHTCISVWYRHPRLNLGSASAALKNHERHVCPLFPQPFANPPRATTSSQSTTRK